MTENKTQIKTAPAVVVMGVSGSGKSTIAEGLAQLLGGQYVEADALHPADNVAHMAAGKPLNDAMRWPWLTALSHEIAERAADAPDQPVVTACSALKRIYRDHIRQHLPGVIFVYLDGDYDLIASRMAARQDHFMPTTLLDSQFATLEIPKQDEGAIHVSIAPPIDAVIRAAYQQLKPRL